MPAFIGCRKRDAGSPARARRGRVVRLLWILVVVSSAAGNPSAAFAEDPFAGQSARDPGDRRVPTDTDPGTLKRDLPHGALLTLESLEELALAHNPTLEQGQALIERARGQWWQAGRYPNPVLSYQGSEIGNEGNAGQQGAFIGQEFVTAGKLGMNRAAAAEGIQRAAWQREAQRLRVMNDVRRGFYEVLAAQQTISLATQLEEVAAKGVELADALLKAAAGTRSDLLQAEIELNEVRITLQTARSRHAAAWRRLTSVIGVPELSPALLEGSLEDELPPLDWDETVQQLLTASPQLQAAQAQVNQAIHQLRRQQAEPIPNVNVQAGVQYDYATRDTVAGVQVGVALPIHNQNRGNIAAAAADVRRAQAELQRLQLSLRDRLAGAFRRYETAQYQVERYRLNIQPRAQQNLELSTEGYRLGEFGFLQVLTARRTYFQTNLAYLQALTELRLAAVDVSGLLLTGGLDEVAE